MKRLLIGLSFLISLIAVLALTACDLPGFNFNSKDASSSLPASTPNPAQTITPSPINPGFNIPTTTANVIPVGATDFVSVISKVRPSVVAINTTVPTLSIFGSSVDQQGAGSGWIIDSSGLIVTNNHVVEGANTITVTLEDGRNFSADTVRTDPVTDLAVVKINAQNLPRPSKWEILLNSGWGIG